MLPARPNPRIDPGPDGISLDCHGRKASGRRCGRFLSYTKSRPLRESPRLSLWGSEAAEEFNKYEKIPDPSLHTGWQNGYSQRSQTGWNPHLPVACQL